MTASHFCNIVDLRSRLKHLTIKNASAPLCSLSKFGYNTIPQLYIHYWHCYASKLIAEAELLRSNYEPNSRREFKRILEKDTSELFNTVCAYAWCTVNDEDRWENLTDLPTIIKGMVDDERDKLESLSYGLITRYYLPVQRYASYVCGYTITDEIRGLNKVDIEFIDNKAFDRTLNVLRTIKGSEDMTVDKLKIIIKDVCMTIPDDYEYDY